MKLQEIFKAYYIWNIRNIWGVERGSTVNIFVEMCLGLGLELVLFTEIFS